MRLLHERPASTAAEEVAPRLERVVEVGAVAAAHELARQRVVEAERLREGGEEPLLVVVGDVRVPVVGGDAKRARRDREVEGLVDVADLAARGEDPAGPRGSRAGDPREEDRSPVVDWRRHLRPTS